jgi:hypothetical protein
VTKSVLPLKPWVIKTRKAFLWVGLGWPVVGFFYAGIFGEHSATTWAMIGVTFMAMLFLPVALLPLILLPTYKSRIIGIPPLLAIAYFMISGGIGGLQYFLLWIVIFTAITLVIPQASTMEMRARQMFRK